MSMIRISSTARLSIGLAVLTIGILLSADLIGLIPNRSKVVLDERKKTLESLAVHCSVAAQRDDAETIRNTVEALVKRNEDILSAAAFRVGGKLLVQAGDHSANWKGTHIKASSSTNVRVPVFNEDRLWGMIEVRFKQIGGRGISGILMGTLVRLILFFLLAGFVVYRFFLKKTLRHLDPSSVVPPRVKAALDTLSEGIVIVDKNERIVLANAAFAKKVGQPASSLLGVKATKLNWTLPQSKEAAQEFPWIQALSDKQSHSGLRLGLPTAAGQWQTFMVNGAPILDDGGNCRGALATFDDVTKMEEQNEQLQVMLKKLEKSRDEIRSKNKELKILATTDPLTGCLNRRSFFERFEIDFSSSKRYGHDLSCIMLDIDHFKNINDTHGHAAGDRVLKGVASVLTSLLRKSDAIGRYGGEEFCIVLPHIDIDGALQAAERYRRGIESYDFSGISVTASFGVSCVDSGVGDVSELIDRADKSLYAAKDGGRNRVVCLRQANPGAIDEISEVTAVDNRITSKGNATHPVAEPGLTLADADDNVLRQVQTASHVDEAGSTGHDGHDAPLGQGDTKEIVDSAESSKTADPMNIALSPDQAAPMPEVDALYAPFPGSAEPERPKSEGSKLHKTASAISEEDEVSQDDSHHLVGNRDALGLVSNALKDSYKSSGSMGLHVSHNKRGDAAVQLNENGSWADSGKPGNKKRSHSNAISRAAKALRQTPEIENTP